MASNPIYQFYAELNEFEPKIWRRFQLTDNMTVARLGYVVQVLFEMKASHLMALEVPIGANFDLLNPDWAWDKPYADDAICRYEIPSEEDALFDDEFPSVKFCDATKTMLRRALSRPGEKINLNYDFGDNWWVALTLEKVFVAQELPGKELPRVLEGAGFGIVEDCGGVGSLEELAKAFKKKKGSAYEEYSQWLGLESFDITDFDLDDMNFRLKKIPRIYKQCYEDRLMPTQQSISLLERMYLEKP